MIDPLVVPTENTQGRVMVVDDEPDVRKAMNLVLTKAGYQVIEAGDGEEAIKILNSDDNPLEMDCILCDIRLPKINGVEAITYFRSNYRTLPVIVVTGFPNVELATSLLKKGVVDYLVKPVEREKLTSTVASAIKNRPSRGGFA